MKLNTNFKEGFGSEKDVTGWRIIEDMNSSLRKMNLFAAEEPKLLNGETEISEAFLKVIEDLNKVRSIVAEQIIGNRKN